MIKDINLIYYGGSGGFYLLYQLLLTKEFVCYFDVLGSSDLVDLKKVITQQFTVNDFKDWKKNEVSLDNEFTKSLISDKRKLYLYCGKIKNFEPSASNILLYTDYKSQLRLSGLKNAYYWRMSIKIDREFFKNTIKKTKDNLLKEVYLTKYGIEKYGGMSVKLQEVITVEGLTKFFEKINVQITDENIKFLQYWKSLHPPELLKKIQAT